MICEFPLPVLKILLGQLWAAAGGRWQEAEGKWQKVAGTAESPIEFIFYALAAEATKIADERWKILPENR